MTTDAREVQESSAALKEWQNLIAQTSDRVRNIVAEVIDRHAMDCVQRFYDVLLNNVDAAPFLSNEIVDTRLRAALGRWLAELFSHDAPDADALVQTQKRIGGGSCAYSDSNPCRNAWGASSEKKTAHVHSRA